MKKAFDIIVPRETVNDDTVTITEWNFKSGDSVKKGDLLLVIETSKASIEVEAQADGFIEIIAPAETVVEVGACIAKLHMAKQSVGVQTQNHQRAIHRNGKGGTRITKLAAEMIRQNNIPLEIFEGKGLIRRAEVQGHLDTVEAKIKIEEKVAVVDKTIVPDLVFEENGKGDKGGFFSDAKKSANDRGKSVFWLGLNYFFRNYLLGLIVRISPLGVVLLVHKLRGVKMGKGVFIDPSATIETAYPENITIGNDVRVTANSVIMTHIKAPHHLRETGLVPMVLKPVVLEDSCFIGVNAVIMPGVTIGKGAVVTSGSTVLNDVEAYTMVSGNPAKLIRRFAIQKQAVDQKN